MPETRWTDLYSRFETLCAGAPGLRARDAADQLGVSEAELVAAKTVPGWAKPLVPEPERGFAPVLEAMPGVGEVMVLTRNAHAVHERHGIFDHVSIGKQMGIVANHTIDLRLFMSHWCHAFALEEEVKSGKRLSLQFFDASGTAVHKIYATAATDRAAFDAVIAEWKGDRVPEMMLEAPATPPLEKPDSEINLERLRRDWLALRDTHQFFGLLRQNGVTRRQAMRLVGDDMAFRTDPASVTRMLERAAAKSTPIMVFVRNRGCIQIHSGPIKRVAPMGPWINVLDPEFNLHLRTDRVAEAWIVRKPTDDGIVSALEVFDTDGECFAMFFGERKPGIPELEGWRDILDDLVLEGAQ